jgi:hypothetical protein
MPGWSNTWLVFGLALLGNVRDVVFHILFFMSWMRTSFVLPTKTFLILVSCQFGWDVIMLLGLMVAYFMNMNNPTQGNMMKRMLAYIVYYTKHILGELWLFTGVVYWYVTYNDDITGTPSPSDNPLDLNILQGLYLFSLVICLTNIWRWIQTTLKITAMKRAASGKGAYKSEFDRRLTGKKMSN